MNTMRVKGTFVALSFVCLVGSVLVWGCSMCRDNHPRDDKNAAMPSGKALVIELNNNPEYQHLLGNEPKTCGMRSGRVYLKPGEDCGQHSTKANEETLVFLSGKGTALIGEKETAFEVGQGKVCYIPPHTLHNIRNTSTEPLVYIYCVAPVQSGTEGHSQQQEHHH